MTKKPTRDKEQYVYFTVRIEKSNPLLQRLEQDRKSAGRHYLAEMIIVRVADYYTLIDRLSQMTLSPGTQQQEPHEDDADVDDMIDAYAKYE